MAVLLSKICFGERFYRVFNFSHEYQCWINFIELFYSRIGNTWFLRKCLNSGYLCQLLCITLSESTSPLRLIFRCLVSPTYRALQNVECYNIARGIYWCRLLIQLKYNVEIKLNQILEIDLHLTQPITFLYSCISIIQNNQKSQDSDYNHKNYR